jgi:hypothetical protein
MLSLFLVSKVVESKELMHVRGGMEHLWLKMLLGMTRQWNVVKTNGGQRR